MESIVRGLLYQKEYVEFYVGRNGDLDISAATAIKRAQKALGNHNSSLILVLPYPAKDQKYYREFYDEVYLPIDRKTHFKAAITKRNEWMIDHSDLLIAYVKHSHGGAYKALLYAEMKGIKINNICLSFVK